MGKVLYGFSREAKANMNMLYVLSKITKELRVMRFSKPFSHGIGDDFDDVHTEMFRTYLPLHKSSMHAGNCAVH